MTSAETTPETTPETERASSSALAAALAAVQAELPHVAKDKRADVRSDKGSYSYKYADLADVTEAIMPVLGRHGLAFTTSPTLHAGAFVLRYDLLHESGESLGGWYPLPDPSRGTPQAMGSAITYARRYCLSAVTGVAADQDDDAQTPTVDYRSQQERPQQRRAARRQDADEAPPEADDDTQAARARRAAQMLDQVLRAATREAAVNLWKITKGSAFRDVDISGLLDDHARVCLGVVLGEALTIQQAAARAGAFVKANGRAIVPVREADAPPVGSEAEAEMDDHEAAERAESGE